MGLAISGCDSSSDREKMKRLRVEFAGSGAPLCFHEENMMRIYLKQCDEYQAAKQVLSPGTCKPASQLS